jgi:TetR/AcrR family transcriptional regulator, cholesterol catabolism regulator
MTDRANEPDPRRRILDAALELVSDGGYDALQVRALCDKASVSSRTVYAHFPSLDSLLIVAVAGYSQGLYARYVGSAPRGRTAAARVQKLIAELNAVMTANQTMAAALLRALLSGKPDVVPYVRQFGETLQTLLANAIAPKGATAADRQTAELLQAIWFTALIGWATGLDSHERIGEIMRQASKRLLAGR